MVVAIREGGGRNLPEVFKTEASAVAWIKSRVSTDTTIMADEASSWNDLHGRYSVERISHGQLYSTGLGTYISSATGCFPRLRRGEIGHHHHVAGAYLVRCAQEFAWREDHRRMDDRRQVSNVAGLAIWRRLRLTGAGSSIRPSAVIRAIISVICPLPS